MRKKTVLHHRSSLLTRILFVVLIATTYGLCRYVFNLSPVHSRGATGLETPRIQKEWINGGRAEERRAQAVVQAMTRTFWKYKARAWSYDDFLPISGSPVNAGFGSMVGYGWAAFIVQSSTMLALIGSWEELSLAVDHIIDVPFGNVTELVDPNEATVRYLGALVSLVDLVDAGIVPTGVVPKDKRDRILNQAQFLADHLAPAFDSPSGMLWPYVNFTSAKGVPDPASANPKDPSITPSHTGSILLANRVLTRLTGDPTYALRATRAWTPIVWPRYVSTQPHIKPTYSPISLSTGAPLGHRLSWDAEHLCYYTTLLRATILTPHDKYSRTYSSRWIRAVDSLRHHLTSRSSPSSKHWKQHLFIGRGEADWYVNEASATACSAPGNIILGGAHLKRPDLIVLGKALLEGCRHVWASSPLELGPERWSWIPMTGSLSTVDATFNPRSQKHATQLEEHGFWVPDSRFRFSSGYVESLFYAWRITGEQRYREWAWDAFSAIERICKSEFGWAAVGDVMAGEGQVELLDVAVSGEWVEMLRWFWMTFADQQARGTDLDGWVFGGAGHPVRRMVAM